MHLKNMVCGGLLLLLSSHGQATPSENNNLRVLPAPAKVTIDGKADDWDLSAGVFACDDVENQRDKYALWIHAMYDSNNLYLLARFTDETPLNNAGQTIGDYGFQGDSLQFRVITAPGDPANEQISHWTCWRGSDGADIITKEFGKDIDPHQTIRDTKSQGAQQAFTINPDGKGYIQELAIPWKLLTKDGKAPAAGSDFILTFNANFTVGAKGRFEVKELFKANMRPDRVFTFMAPQVWGKATLEAKPGPVKPQKERIADGREFPVRMEHGFPVVDWSGLVIANELPGFKSIPFTMPEDGYISLNIKATDGTVVRQLLNAAPYTKGPHEVKWDGLTTPNAHVPGESVPAGDYTWSALFHKEIGLKLRGWANNSGSAPWDNGDTSNWGGDEGNPSFATADGSQVYLGWACAEAGSALLGCDREGNMKWKNKRRGIAGVQSLAASNGTVYVLESLERSLYKVKAADGQYVAWSGGSEVNLPVGPLAADLPGHPTAADSIAAHGDKLYLSFNGAGKILVLDAASGKVLQTLDVAGPTAMQVGSDGGLVVLSGKNSVVRFDASNAAKTVVSGLTNATALALDKEDNIYVGVGDPDNQVKVFDKAGKALSTIGRQGGRSLLGKWNPDGMRFISSLAIAGDGKLWVVESDAFPRRISVWDAKSGAFTKELFGSTDYGATGGAISPLDPNVMVGAGCEWKLDPATGRASCVAVITRDGMENSRFGIGSNGRLYLAVSPKSAITDGACDYIFERTGEGEYALRGKFYYDINADKSTTTRYWADANGDGQEQTGEFTTAPGNLRFTMWYMAFAPDMTFYSFDPTLGELQFKVTGFTSAGAPLYDLAHPVVVPEWKAHGNNGGIGSADDRFFIYNGFYIADRSWFDVYDIASGKMVWRYPDNFVGVHGSHNATPPEIGMIRGDYGITGTAQLPAPIGNIWVIGTNVGEWHILTGDGFYLTKLFEGDELKVHWPKDAVPGADMTSAPPGLGGEDFGGSISYGKDGKLYIQAGKTGFWNLEVTGLDTVKAISGGKISISTPELAKAQNFRETELQTVVGKSIYVVKKSTPVFIGDLSADFKNLDLLNFQKSPEAAVTAVATWDDQNLYLAWDAVDASPWINTAKVPEDMYVDGDTVDFQLGTDPKADKDRAEAAAGDLRLSIGNFQGKATAVLYRKISDTKKPKIFSSGVVHSYPMDYVDVLADAKITIKTRANGYVVEAAIPLAALGLKPTAGLRLSGDFGATHGGSDNTTTRLRTYWNNQHTGLVDDAVFELEMEPKNWGQLQFAP